MNLNCKYHQDRIGIIFMYGAPLCGECVKKFVGKKREEEQRILDRVLR